MEWRWHSIENLVRQFGLTNVGVEVGVKEGKFSAHLLRNFQSLRMIGVDPYEQQPQSGELGYEDYSGWSFDRILEQLKGNTGSFGDRFRLIRKYSEDAAPEIDDGSIDFVFIDAQHTYEGVKSDIALWRGKVREGGILCGHDYDFTRPRFADVIRAVDESLGKVETAADHVWWKRL
jgi:hypothetical protein